MKKMIYNSRRNFILICTTCAIFTFSACGDDFLNIAPQGSLTEALFPQTEADALLAVNAVYGTLHNWSYWYGGFPITDILSDDARKGRNPVMQRVWSFLIIILSPPLQRIFFPITAHYTNR